MLEIPHQLEMRHKGATENTPPALGIKGQDEEGSDTVDSTPQLVTARGINLDSELPESASDSEYTNPPVERRATRTQRQPVWMMDYEIKELASKVDS